MVQLAAGEYPPITDRLQIFLESAWIYNPDVVLSGDEKGSTKQELTVSEGGYDPLF